MAAASPPEAVTPELALVDPDLAEDLRASFVGPVAGRTDAGDTPSTTVPSERLGAAGGRRPLERGEPSRSDPDRHGLTQPGGRDEGGLLAMQRTSCFQTVGSPESPAAAVQRLVELCDVEPLRPRWRLQAAKLGLAVTTWGTFALLLMDTQLHGL